MSFNPTATFGQGPLQSGSVFNFFSPFMPHPVRLRIKGSSAPSFEIATEYQNTVLTRAIWQQAFTRNSRSKVTDPDAIVIDVEEEFALAGNASALVSRVAEKLLAGQISTTLQTEAEAAVRPYPSDQRGAARWRGAVVDCQLA